MVIYTDSRFGTKRLIPSSGREYVITPQGVEVENEEDALEMLEMTIPQWCSTKQAFIQRRIVFRGE